MSGKNVYPCKKFDFDGIVNMIQKYLYDFPEDEQARDLLYTLNERALKHYVVQTQDIRECPADNCSAAGIVEIS